MSTNNTNSIARPPVVAVMGHIDHGKSTLLDYIRKSNTVAGEAGGITQHISAYEAHHKGQDGNERTITFLDTPGHEAFSKMRSRGARVADVAILVVSAEDGVKAQTLEALSSILNAKLPYIVAINKIDKPNANIESTKNNLLENEIYLEGLGGHIPWVPVSAKTGEGMPELLDLVLLASDLEEFTGDKGAAAEGVVIESNVDTKKGISATLVIKDGTLSSGMFVVVGNAIAPVRIMEDFTGKAIKEASFSSPIRVIGFNSVPQVGETFLTYKTKKEAEKAVAAFKEHVAQNGTQNEDTQMHEEDERAVIPVIIKTDVLGSLDAIKHELEKLHSDRTDIRIVSEGVGAISEGDVKVVAGSEREAIIVGFNVDIDNRATELAERSNIEIKTFTVIYDLAKWLDEAVSSRTPKKFVDESTGQAKILKSFSRIKDKQVVGGRVLKGTLTAGTSVKILRNDEEVGRGKVLGLQSQKNDVKEIKEEQEFGSQIQSTAEIAPGDIIETFIVVEK